MKRALLVAALLLTVALAGCTKDKADDDPKTIDGKVGDDFVLGAGFGAITGLLVDDRYRPIHLRAEPAGPAQKEGFILLQETGQQVGTNENGEFTFVDLEPGSYRLRVTAEGHEAVPQTVTVVEGEFAEASLVARRMVSTDGSIVTNEFTVFKACEATLIVIGSPVPCTADLSGDTDRDSFIANYAEFEDATYMVTEFLANQAGFYEIRLGSNGTIGGCGSNYAIDEIVDGRYLKIINKLGEPREENHLTCGNVAWENDDWFRTILYVDGVGKGILPVFGGGFGFGVYFAIEGKFIHSVFRGEPEEPIESYCAICGYD